jgi:hypothetical protein
MNGRILVAGPASLRFRLDYCFCYILYLLDYFNKKNYFRLETTILINKKTSNTIDIISIDKIMS